MASHIGRYEVLAPLGRGGMGVVYLARDDVLDRDVAIKVLSEDVARDPERLAWFEREAKSLASLNHPGIATIHGFEASPDGTRFIVLERVEGGTLAERLRHGPLPVGESIAVGLQIADAVGAAHERGIVHRDLKPGNVMITPKGRIKVLDFGLAKRTHALDSAGEPAGLGTPGYASPEQIRGEDVDRRADVFALGCILFECLSGRAPFARDTSAEVIEATVRAEPSWEALPAEIPPVLRSLLVRCLEKDPTSRPAGVDDVANVLADAAGVPATPVGRGPSQAPGARRQLPVALTRFLGRERELGECLRLLGRTRLLTLMGVAGCGKTRLALELAGRSPAEYRDTIAFVDLAPVREAARVFDGIAAAIGVKESPGAPIESGVVDTLRSRRTLLLLDNCEHLVTELAALVQRLLEACAELKIVATSREALEIPGERIFPVDPLTTPDVTEQSVAGVLRSESVALFLDRARLADPDFNLTEENADAIGEICRRLDGIPLALELAAARLHLLSLQQIRSRLADRFRLLAAPARAVTQHHQTLHAAIGWSHDQMAEIERVLFRRLAVFSGGWTLEAATAVAGEETDEFAVLDLLTRLWSKSLIVVDRAGPESPRYRYLETIREFALERLNEAGEEGAIRDRHLGFYSALAERSYPILGRAADGSVGRLASDHHNFLEALHWCGRSRGRDAEALRLASFLWGFWMVRAEYATGRRALAAALDRPGAQERTSVRARALYGAGWLASLQGDWAAARAWMEESLEIGRAIDDSKAVSRALSGLGVVALDVGDYGTAREYGVQSLELNRRIGNDKGIAASLNGLGNLAFRQGDFEEARTFMEQALSLHRARRDQEGVAGALCNLAEIHLRLGSAPDARSTLLESLETARGIDAKHIVAVALANAGKLASTFEDSWHASRLIGAAEAIWKTTGFELPASDRKEHEAELERLGSILGSQRLARAREEGGRLSLDAAVEAGLRYLGGSAAGTVTR